MSPTYYIYNTKLGWLSRGYYVSEIEKALTYSRDEAFEICRHHMEQGKIVSIPVATSDILFLQGAK